VDTVAIDGFTPAYPQFAHIMQTSSAGHMAYAAASAGACYSELLFRYCESMQIQRLVLHRMRCFDEATFSPGPGLNLISGDNGAGKSTLLEALHLMAYARSFRGRVRDGLVDNDGQDCSTADRNGKGDWMEKASPTSVVCVQLWRWSRSSLEVMR
jgi:hypothetical protein